MHSHLADIDELVLLCRDDESRKYIAEAVASYKVGAFRACIVMTWIAVQFDFISKLQILADRGNTQARDCLKEFEKARKIALESKDYKKAQEFENSVLAYAKDEFEFITASECEELERLQRDRNKCAHPYMVTLDEPYQPTAELARYHLKNAVVYFLQYPPTHGKSLISDLIEYTKEEYFPEQLDQVINTFRSWHLDRAKSSAIRSLVLAMIKGLLRDETFDGKQFRRTSNALNALRRIQREICEKTIEKHLSEIMIKVDDVQLVQSFKFLHSIDDTYQYLRADARIRLNSFLLKSQNVEMLSTALTLALDTPQLKTVAKERISELQYDGLIQVYSQSNGHKELFKPIMALCLGANNKDEAQILADNLLIPLLTLSWVKEEHIDSILDTCEKNDQLKYYEIFLKLVLAIQEIMPQENLTRLLSKYPDCDKKYVEIFEESSGELPL